MRYPVTMLIMYKQFPPPKNFEFGEVFNVSGEQFTLWYPTSNKIMVNRPLNRVIKYQEKNSYFIAEKCPEG